MKRLLLACLLLAACQTTAPQAPPPPGRAALAEGLPWTLGLHPASVGAPEVQGGEARFSLARGQCAGGDCGRGAGRMALSGGEGWRLGFQNMFGFEINIDPDLAYRGRGLSVARWSGADTGRVLFGFDLDAQRGLTFLGRSCVAPQDFGQWRRVYVRMEWAGDDAGFIEVRCGAGQVHEVPVIFAASGLPTNRPLACTAGGACRAGDERGAERFEMQLGLIADRVNALPAGGVGVSLRRFVERRLYVIFDRVESL